MSGTAAQEAIARSAQEPNASKHIRMQKCPPARASDRTRIGQGHPRESTHDRMLHLQFRCSSPSLARLEAAAWQRRYSGGAAAAGVACWGARGSVVPSIQQCGGSSMTAAVSHHQRAARPPAERVRRRLGYRPPNARRLRSLRTMVCATTASRLRNDRYAPRCTRWILHTTVLQ